MFLTDKDHHHHLHLPTSNHCTYRVIGSNPTPFESTLSTRLRSLLPIPITTPSSSSLTLALLLRLADLVAATLTDAAAAVIPPSAADVACHVDSGVSLLDACNSIAAAVDRLRRRLLLLRFAVHLLSSSSPSRDSLLRARAAISESNQSALPPQGISSLVSFPSDLPRGSSASRRVIYAVEAVSALLVSTIAAFIPNGAANALNCRVNGDYLWAEGFNKLAEEVSRRSVDGFDSGMETLDDAVKRLTASMDAEDNQTETLKGAVDEVKKLTEELTAGLDGLTNSVDGVFRAALALRNVELRSFRIGAQKM